MKIIELLLDELEDFAGFDAVALVNQPAIEAGFHAFNSDIVHEALAFQIIKEAMKDQFVTRIPGESKDDYLGRCIPKLRDEGYPQDQATAICHDTFDLDVTNLPDYITTGSKFIDDYEFESYTDYPQSATNAAKRALEWKESHPDNDCGTRVGLARANQLANRRPISEDTIARMASFKRHQQHKDVPYSEGCGGLVWDLWGGTAGIEWASNKLEEIRMSSLPQDKFFDDLPSNVQEKLLERLEKVGYSLEDLQEDYIITDKPQKFALPTRRSANPDGPTETKGAYKILYKYNGPRDSKTRTFCRRLLDLNLLFRKEDIDKMTLEGANSSEFGFYDIFQYKGSYGCRHNWVKQYVYKKKSTGLLEIAALLLDQEKQTKDNLKNPQTVEAFSKKFTFATDDEQQIVVGPMMLPDKLILRVDENEEPYYVFFSEETIRKIAYKMMEEKKLDEINLEHDQDSSVKGHMLESWIVEDVENDKQQIYGMSYPVGTWMGMYKIEDDEVWKMVKDGTVTGFSIEAFLVSRHVQASKTNI